MDRQQAVLTSRGGAKYDGRTWLWGQGNVIPMMKAETNHKDAVEYLVAYNKAVAAGKATYSPRADSLMAFLDRVIADLGSMHATIDAAADVLTSLRKGASFDPLIIVNGSRDSVLAPSHLSTLGFELASARIQMTEIRDVLQK